MDYSQDYKELYNDIANYRELTEEQKKKLENLTPHEMLNLIKLYDKVVTCLKEAGLL